MSPKKIRPTARTADRFALYLASVQDPVHEVKILSRVYQDAFGRQPRVLREDFCGTAAVCAQWAKSAKDRVAYGIDLDPNPLDWGRLYNVALLKPHQRERVHLLQEDVRSQQKEKADIVAAQNFSFFIFKQREQVKQYVTQLEKQLPSKAEMDALLSDINQAGLGRSLQFDLFRPGQIAVKDYYAELPIAIRVTGRYHDMGAFASDIANLSRIVTLNNLNIQPVRDNTLSMDATAKTFRYLDATEIAAQSKATAAKGVKK